MTQKKHPNCVKITKLHTPLKAEAYGKSIDGAYSASIEKNTSGRNILCIHPCKGTAGCWRYRLEDLLVRRHIAPCDVLWLEADQDWCVTGMLELYREIVNM